MSGLSKLSAALVIIFVISSVALFAELFYVLWRRLRFFHRQTPTQTTMQNDAAASTFTSFSSCSKEQLMYFFCLKNGQISRVEPNSTPPRVNSEWSCPEDEIEVIDVFALQNRYGLFTIKEEDKENEMESDKSLCSSAEKGTKKHNNSKRVNLEECFKADDDESTPQQEVAVAEAVAVGDDHISMGGETERALTPFSTPCESPLYFTPSASPTPQLVDSGQNGTCLYVTQTTSCVGAEV